MDIRGFFTPKGGSSKPSKPQPAKEPEKPKQKKRKIEAKKESPQPKQRRKVAVISDSDEDPLPEELRPEKKKKEDQSKRKATMIESDDGSKESPAKKVKVKSQQGASSSKEIKAISSEEFFSETSKPISSQSSKDKSKSKRKSDGAATNVIPESPPKASVSKETASTPPQQISLANRLSKKASEKKLKDTKNEPEKESLTPPSKRQKSADDTKSDKSPSVSTKDKKPKNETKKSPNEKKVAESPVTPAEKTESRKAGYRSFMAREGPQALGSKEIPEGAENCLEGMTFVVTGVLESIERDQASDLIKKHGGKVTQAVSKRTSYLVTGRDGGASKLEKATKVGTKLLDEDGLFDLIRSTPGKISSYDQASKIVQSPSQKKSTPVQSPKTAKSARQSKSQSPSKNKRVSSTTDGAEDLLWVDKYKPTIMKDIVGQQGEKSNAHKLYRWLLDWRKSRKTKPKGFFAGKESGSLFKAALLSGSPGIGKTTTATLVCKEAGFSFVELNASDARSKKTLENVVAGSLKNTTIDNLMKGNQLCNENHVLIMDEVDGMAGNEDRGGVQELIAMIKSSQIPIICMCNDRNHPKIRSLANHCFDLRFQRPRIEQIKAFGLRVAFKEGVKIPPPAMEQIIIGANQDLRQVLHNMQMWTATDKSMTFESAKSDAKLARKNIKLGPFEIVRKLLSASEERTKMSIMDKTDLFFMDYSFVPLFIQENYIHCGPLQARGNGRKHLELIAEAADSISDSNLIEKLIRGSNAWSLLPLQGFYSCVVPTDAMHGGLRQQIEFPQWLGKNSSRSKHDRILQELKTHMMLSMHGNKTDLNLDYIWMLKNQLMVPLTDERSEPADAVNSVVEFMNSYDLNREDWDSVAEISKWSGVEHPTEKIPSKVKSAFTRTYNKGSHLIPYAVGSVAKKSKAGKSAAADDGILLDEDNEEADNQSNEDNDDEVDISKDPNIKIGKGTRKIASGKGKGSASKGGKGTTGKKKLSK